MKKIILLIGTSGSGKTEMGKYIELFGGKKIVTHTTRDKRKGEIDDISYYFVSKDKFEEPNMFEKTEYVGNFYGTSEDEIYNKLKESDTLYVVVEKNGLLAYKEFFKDKDIKVISIFLYTSKRKLKSRMFKRGDNIKDIKKRLKNIDNSNELEAKDLADYIIKNDKLNKTKKKILKISGLI